MGFGLECYDASGALTFTADDHLARFLGSVSVSAGVDGSKTVTGMGSLGTAFYFFLSNGESTWQVGAPDISISGDVVSWAYNGRTTASGTASSGTIFYGVN